MHMGEYPPIQDKEAISEAVEQLSGKSREELFDCLKEATRQEKEAGNMDNLRMDEIYQKLSPYLSDAQRAKMQEVLAKLKE